MKRSGTSQDAKAAREALLKQLAELPISADLGKRRQAREHKQAIAKAAEAVAPGSIAKS
jgi:hypothetical protein